MIQVVTDVLVVRPVEDGFLCPPGDPNAGKTNPNGFVFLATPGVTRGLQYFRFEVATADDSGTEHFVLNASSAGDPTGVAALEVPHLERAFPAAVHTLLTDARPGWARAQPAGTRGETLPAGAAACVAAVCAGAAWDESDPIVVEIGGRDFAASLVHGAQSWTATIRYQAAS